MTASIHHEEAQLFILLLVPKFIKAALVAARLKVAILVAAIGGLTNVVVVRELILVRA